MNTGFFKIVSFFNYLIKRKSIQYIHSPFLFSLMQYVFDDSKKNRPPVFYDIENHRKTLTTNKKTIVFNDYGTGGDKKKEKNIAIKKIAIKSLKQAKYARFLYRLVKHIKPLNVVELGTSLGITTVYLSLGVEGKGQICTVEADKNIQVIAKENWEKILGENKIKSYLFDGNEKWPMLCNNLEKIDFLFIDANHRKEAMIRYLLQAMPYLHKKSVVVFDDINWSYETLEAWTLIKERKEVSLSFDIYQMGILFFDDSLSKEDYTLKY